MHALYETLFGSTANMSSLQECARAAVIFVYGLLLVRIAGRRAFARWSAVDIVVAIVVGSNLSRAMTGNAPFAGTLVATTLMMFLHWLLARSSARSSRLSRIFEGPSIEIAAAGRLDRSAVLRENVSDADVAEALRSRGLSRIEESRCMVLEPSGKINVLG